MHAVYRRNREVTAFDWRTMAGVTVPKFSARIVRTFFVVDLVESVVHGDIETHVIKDKELRFGAEIGRITNPRAFQISLGALSSRAWVAGVLFTGNRIVHVTN